MTTISKEKERSGQGCETTECCSPSCACTVPPTHKKAKTIVSSLVLAAAIAIVLFKMTACSKLTDPKDAAVEPQAEAAQDIRSIGEPLASFSGLNAVAGGKTAVFVLIPAQGNSVLKKEIVQSINSAKQKLEAKGKIIGLYTLKTDSPDYAGAAAQASLPAVFIMSKGGGKEVVSGEINESRLLQSYVATVRTGAPSSGGGCGCNKGGGAQTCGQ